MVVLKRAIAGLCLTAMGLVPAWGISPQEFQEKYADHVPIFKTKVCPPGFVYQVAYFHARKSYSIFRSKGPWVRRMTAVEQLERKPAAAYIVQQVETPFFIGNRPLACIEYHNGKGRVVWRNDDKLSEKRPGLLDAILQQEGVPSGI